MYTNCFSTFIASQLKTESEGLGLELGLGLGRTKSLVCHFVAVAAPYKYQMQCLSSYGILCKTVFQPVLKHIKMTKTATEMRTHTHTLARLE